jgi:hypothetical protein
LGADPLDGFQIDDRYAPVTISNWKLTPWMHRALLQRRIPQPLEFTSARLTIVIPFRDREEHLRRLLPPLSAVLREQQVDYRILVVEQTVPGLFNRGKLLNIGITHAANATDYYCLHDVDAVPVHANYRCPSQPLRLVNAIVRPEGETRRAAHYFSGAVSVRKEQITAANGLSNSYWGWGKEDDDFFFRLLLAGHVCYVDRQGRYLDLPNPGIVKTSTSSNLAHTRDNRKRRSRLVRGWSDPFDDGLSTLKFQVVKEINESDYSKILVSW